MNRLLVLGAVAVLLILLLVHYMKAGVPPATTGPSGGCAGGCPASQTCTNGTCSDTALPGLITAAQTAVQALYGKVFNQAALFSPSGQYVMEVADIAVAARKYGIYLTAPTFGSDLETCQKALTQYVDYLYVPNCDPTTSANCGYAAQIAVVTPATPSGVILAVAETAAAVPTELIAAVAGYSAVQADINGFTSQISAYQNPPPDLTAGLATLASISAALGSAPDALASLASTVQQTGAALYNDVLA